MGYGVIRVRGKQVELVEMGALHLTKYKDHAVKLKRIFDRCAALIETHARIIWRWRRRFLAKTCSPCSSWAGRKGSRWQRPCLGTFPFPSTPRKVKQAITGSGAASKEQVAAMVARTLAIKPADMPKELDASDGVAVALCHHFQLASPRMQAGYSGWKAFVADQSDRVVAHEGARRFF